MVGKLMTLAVPSVRWRPCSVTAVPSDRAPSVDSLLTRSRRDHACWV